MSEAQSYRLRWRAEPPGLIDGSVLRPDRLCRLPLRELAEVPIRCGSRSWPLADIIAVERFDSVGAERLEVQGSPRFVRLGAGMESGLLEVAGSAGEWLGAGLRGGVIRVRGPAGQHAGAGMSGGTIVIDADAGDFVGGPVEGATRGMTGGEILVLGSAGAEAALRLRRGLVAVAGSCGPYPARDMQAGTLVIGGESGPSPGVGLRRGSLIYLSRRAEVEPGPGFIRSWTGRPVFLRVILRRLDELGFPMPPAAHDFTYRAWSGDSLEGGRGEILAPHDASL